MCVGRMKFRKLEAYPALITFLVIRFYSLIIILTRYSLLVNDLSEAFNLSEEKFKTKYGFEKPSKQQKVIFSCQAGVRARSAAEMAHSLGFNTACYPGSWGEWASKMYK